MAGDLAPLGEDEALLVPVDPEQGLALVAGIAPLALGKKEPASPSLIQQFLRTAGYAAGTNAARQLADGSLVRLAPETMHQLSQGAVLARSRGVALGVLRHTKDGRFAGPARLLPGAANPVAAGMLVQTIAMQGQLQGIQEALQRIDAKIEALHKAQHHEVLAELVAMASALGEMRQKLAAGATLSAEDENQLRALDVRAQTHRTQAGLWLEALEPLLGEERVGLAAQLDTLTDALSSSHVGFWVRARLISDVVFVQTLALKLERAAVAEHLDWALQLQAKAREEILRVGQGLHALHAGMDRYLRRTDIARGFEQLSLRRKRDVRRLRRELWDVANELRDAIAQNTPTLEAAMGAAMPVLPPPLDRRAIEPPGLRDSTADAVTKTRQVASRGAQAATGQARHIVRSVRDRRGT